MNFTDTQKAWIKLVSIVLGTGCGAFTLTLAGGCKWQIALITSVGIAATNVYHALADSPNKNGNGNGNGKHDAGNGNTLSPVSNDVKTTP